MLKRVILSVALLTAMLVPLAACGKKNEEGNGRGQRGATSVGVVEVQPRAVNLTQELTGRTSAWLISEVRPQVGGIIKTIAYKEGSLVKKGDLLFQIEDDSYAAAMAEAQAALAKAEASVPSAQANVERYQKLVNAGATQIELDSAKVTLLQAKADVASADVAEFIQQLQSLGAVSTRMSE